MALGEEEPEEKDEKWLLGRIRCGIRHAIEEQTQRKFEDDYLVAKVEKLEAAVREAEVINQKQQHRERVQTETAQKKT